MTFNYQLAKFIAFRDLAECERVRAIKKSEITHHANPEFKIRLIEDLGEFYAAFATDIVTRIKQALDEGRDFVGIFPVGPMPQYPIAAEMINRLRIPMHHVHTFNMDEYADQDGVTAPATWPGCTIAGPSFAWRIWRWTSRAPTGWKSARPARSSAFA